MCSAGKNAIKSGLFLLAIGLLVGCGGGSDEASPSNGGPKIGKGDDTSKESGLDIGCKSDSDCFSAFCRLTHHSNAAYTPPKPPSTAGTCMNRDGKSCNVDEDCAKGLHCDSDSAMGKSRGICLPDAPQVTSGCAADFECDEGQFCAILTSISTNDGSASVRGECRGQDGTLCNSDAQCSLGKTCVPSAGMHKAWGECQADGCATPGQDCGCKSDGDCYGATGAFCHLTFHSNGAYDPPLPPSTVGTCVVRDGERCNADGDCAQGLSCQQDCGMGKCRGICTFMPPTVTDGCQMDFECEEAEFCAMHISISPNDGSTAVRGECRAKSGDSCNTDAQCDPGKTCVPSQGMHKVDGMCVVL